MPADYRLRLLLFLGPKPVVPVPCHYAVRLAPLVRSPFLLGEERQLMRQQQQPQQLQRQLKPVSCWKLRPDADVTEGSAATLSRGKALMSQLSALMQQHQAC